ncbi:hypothetical protein OROMI_033270 [Orobanche minor]
MTAPVIPPAALHSGETDLQVSAMKRTRKIINVRTTYIVIVSRAPTVENKLSVAVLANDAMNVLNKDFSRHLSEAMENSRVALHHALIMLENEHAISAEGTYNTNTNDGNTLIWGT